MSQWSAQSLPCGEGPPKESVDAVAVWPGTVYLFSLLSHPTSVYFHLPAAWPTLAWATACLGSSLSLS